MNLSVLIPTYQRIAFWRDHRKLLDGLYAQTDPDFECVIVDDGSTDDTVDWLVAHFAVNPPPFALKLIKTKFLRRGEHQSSAAANNVGFRELTGDVILHLDDDMAIGPELVAYAKTLPVTDGKRIVWGAMLFGDKDWQQLPGPVGRDTRWARMMRMKMHGELIKMPPAWRGDWGAVYVIATRVVRALGGHSVGLTGYRSADSRFGHRLRRHGLASCLCVDPRIITMHYGRSWFQQQRNLDNMGKVRAFCRSPGVNISKTQLAVVANGGEAFWLPDSEWFRNAYDVVIGDTNLGLNVR